MLVDIEPSNFINEKGCFQQRRQTNAVDTHPVPQGLVTINDDDGLLQDRDKLQKYIKQYVKKRQEVPPTTLDYYRFMKLIGKGAFGKVTLGIHKLSGK